MPLYDLSYQRYQGQRTSRFRRSLALARTSAQLLVRKRAFLLLLAVSWVPAVVRAAQIYVSRQFPEAPEFFSIDPLTWREFLSQQVRFLPVVLVSLATGASAVASDVASGALAIYFSKPLSRLDYVIGKAIPVAGAIGAVTLVPAFTLLFLHLALAPDLGVLSAAPWLPLSIAAYSIFLALYFTLLVLAVSSLCASGRVAGVGFAALAFGSEIVARTASARASGAPRFPSVIGSAVDSGYWFFADAASGRSPLASVLFMAFVMAFSALVLDRRLRSREAVS